MVSSNSTLTCICQNHEKFETETHLYFEYVDNPTKALQPADNLSCSVHRTTALRRLTCAE